MANYLKGIGDASQRINEILPSLDARIYYFLCGHTAGIIKGEFYEFAANAIDRGVRVRSGMMQAHGYFGCADTDTQINFVMPSTTQYCHLYAEIDLSVVPNRFEIKATALSNGTAFSARQDNLRSIPNGRYQFHLWQVTLTASTIILSDRRNYIDKPLNAVNAEYSETQPQTEDSTRVATTSYVRRAVSDALNIRTGAVLNASGVSIGTVKRQANFVIVSVTAAAGTNIGTIPEGFRPRTTVSIGGSGNLTGGVAATWPGSDNMYGTISGTISAGGVISLTGSAFGGWTSPNGGAGMATVSLGTVYINAGYEIT